MNYFRSNVVIKDNTTLTIKTDELSAYMAARKNDIELWVIDIPGTAVTKFLAAQHPECSVAKVTYAQAAPYLRNSLIWEDINQKVTQKIREKYSVDEELQMINRALVNLQDAEFVAYRTYVATCIQFGDQKKIELGLKV